MTHQPSFERKDMKYRHNDFYACDLCGTITRLNEMSDITIEDEDEISGTKELTVCQSCFKDSL
jgi:hypothetical protein